MKSPSTVEDDLNDWGPTPRRSLAQNYNTRRPTAPAGERRAVAAAHAIEPSLTSGRPTLLQLRLGTKAKASLGPESHPTKVSRIDG